MKTRLSYLVFAIASLFCLASCGPKKRQILPVPFPVNTSVDMNGVAAKPAVADVALNDAARFVAGLPIKNKGSKLYALTQTEGWKTHARNMDQIWNSFQQTTPKLIAFAKSELADVNSGYHTLFYPFGGPDYLFPNTFFPYMDTYFLIGLERAGSVIEIEKPSAETYQLYQNAVSDILNLSFFRTDGVKEEIFNDTIDGVVPIISLLMVRSGREIVSIRNMRITNEGDIVAINKDGSAITRGTGLVEFQYFRSGAKKLQTLYYLTADLSNGDFTGNKPLLAYIGKLNISTTATFIKSASYLMHVSGFSAVRQVILSHTSAVVQDDSGIPLPFYKTTDWDVTLYGTFLKPTPQFAKYIQPELRDAYQQEDPKPLSFRIGYAKQSNLQIARKK
ncbi:hypothetical protein [uncultured Bacteroides sp.]|uniref:hypothetical protein n=1 Tax=uncultured Bacteroides sp. TaxID=162156 RepID=UPI002AA8F823|nr:hypothetical protein [uncultured Bacteroides sp.]